MYTYPSPLRLRIGQHLRFESGGEARATVVATIGDPAKPSATSGGAASQRPARAATAGSAATQ
jgi:hypothetical protein